MATGRDGTGERRGGTVLDDNPVVIAYRISFLANFYSGPIYRDIERVHGLPRPEFIALFCLAQGAPLTSADICRMTGRPKNSVSRAVQRLLAAGRIARRPDPDDSRAALLSLTRAGRALYDSIIPAFVERERAMLSVLGPADRAALDRIVGLLVHRQDGWADPY